MGVFFVYILKSSVCLALFYLFYRVLLSKETFHRLNRIALLGLILFSMTIPLFKVITEPVVVQRPVQNLEYLVQMVQEQSNTEAPADYTIGLQGLFLIYISGVAFFFIQYLYSICYIGGLIRKGEKKLLPDGITLVLSDRQVSPFNWMKYIVISRQDMEKREDVILSHEMAHLKAYHSIDLFIAELCVVVQWFNPAAWLLKQELQNVHEYEADESVLNRGVDARKYQLLLIGRAVGSQRFTSIVNGFDHSKLKKRITMMLKRKSTPWAQIKYLYVLPLATLAIVAFARPEISQELEKISNVEINSVSLVSQMTKTDTTKVVEESSGVERKDSKKTEKKKTVPKVKTDNKKEPVNEKKTEIKEAETDTMASNELIKEHTTPVHVIGYSPATDSGIVKLELAQSEFMKKNKPLFPNKHIIPMGSKELGSDLNINVSTIKKMDRNKKKALGVRFVGNDHPLILVDGVERAPNVLEMLDPSTIKSFSVLKNESATKIYGTKASGGVIIIVTEKKEDPKVLHLDIK